ncbi:thioredoxin-like protein [Zopfochytrium polystomum]|nr:thioredoxin-like protein [Zopfochytrium polystomum]
MAAASTVAKRTINVQVTSDIACPWCYIGKKKLEKTIKLAESRGLPISLEIDYLPYELFPNAPRQPLAALLTQKFGAHTVPRLQARMKSVAAAEGLDFNYGGATGSTKAAHRLVRFAKARGKQSALLDEIFADHHERERDICDFEVLADAAQRVGIDRGEALEYLKSGEGDEEHERLLVKARLDGITSVPTYDFAGGKFVVSGADPDALTRIMESLAKE